MKIHHIGFITGDISETAKAFESLGYVRQQIFDDIIQRCHICFLKRDDGDLIELVQPYESNKTMRRMLSKRGVSPYHLCYEVKDVCAIYAELSNAEGWLPLFAPVEAVALENRKITYFLNAACGFIEFLNE